MKKYKSRSIDEIWLRDINELVEDEFEFYRQALITIVTDLEKNYKGKKVLVEGAAILPEFIKNKGIDYNNYVCIIPTKKFQVDQYSKREWVEYYLSDCSEPGKAFGNWMERDAKYAEIVSQNAKNFGMNVIVVDGSKSIEENYIIVK